MVNDETDERVAPTVDDDNDDVLGDDVEVDVDCLLVSNDDISLLMFGLQGSPLRKDSGKMPISTKETLGLDNYQFYCLW